MLSILLTLATLLPLPGRELAPPSYGVSLQASSHVATATSGTTFLTVWRGAGSAVRGSLADAEGKLLTPVSFAIVNETDADWIDLVGLNGGYALFWGDDDRVYMAKLDANATILSSRVTTLPRDFHASAVWNGEHFFLAGHRIFDSTQRRIAYVLDTNGDVVRGPIDLEWHDHFRIGTAGRDFVVAYFNHTGLWLQRFTSDGTPQARVPIELPSRGDTYFPFSLAMTSDGTNVLLAWHAWPNMAAVEVHTALVTPDGTFTKHVIAEANLPFAVTRRGNGYILVLGRNEGVFAMRVDAQGRPAGPAQPLLDRPVVAVWDVATNDETIYAATALRTDEGQTLVGVAFDDDLQPQMTAAISTALTLHTAPMIVSDGMEFLASWADRAAGAQRMQAARVAATGVPLNLAEFAHTPGYLGSHTITSSGNEYLVVWVHGSATFAMRVARDGSLIDREPILLATNNRLRIPMATWTGSSYLIVSIDQRRVESVVLTPGGTPSEIRTFDITIPTRPNHIASMHAAELAWNGREVLAVGIAVEQPSFAFPIIGIPFRRTVAFRMNANGEAIDTTTTDLAHDTFFSSVATSGDEFLVTVDKKDSTHTIVVRGITPSEPRLLFQWGAGTVSDVAWNGREYVVATVYSMNREHFLSLRRVDREGREHAPASGLPILSSSNPDVAANAMGDAMIVIAEARNDGVQRAVAYADEELRPLPSAPAAPRDVRLSFAGTLVTVEWSDASPDERGFVVEQLTPQGWTQLARVDANVTRATAATRGTGAMRVRAWHEGGFSTAAEAPAIPRRRSVRR